MTDDTHRANRLDSSTEEPNAVDPAGKARAAGRKGGLVGIGVLLLALLSKAKGLLVGAKVLSLGKVLTTGGSMLLDPAAFEPGPALACSGLGLATARPIFFALAHTGFFLNLFNCLPISPLDGGRVAAAISRWLWVAGLVVALPRVVWTLHPILILIVVLGAVRAFKALRKERLPPRSNPHGLTVLRGGRFGVTCRSVGERALRYAHRLAATLVAAGVLASHPARGGTPPAGLEDYELFTASVPVALAYEPGSGNAFVAELGDGSGGARVRRRALSSGTVTTALSLTCVDSGGERGLLGIAFDPDYLQDASTRWVYLYYTRLSPGSGSCAIPGSPGSRNRVARFKEANGTLSGEQLVLEGPVLTSATNHNGGTLRFAADKTLFVSMGDNDTDEDPLPKSRDLADLRGKILRINRDGTVPLNNPFVGQAGKRPEIWAWGLRNPFRFSIDPLTGTPWIGDVGENRYEELDRGVAGGDYGYPCYEGNATFQPCSPMPPSPIFPALVYGHSVGVATYSGSTIIGGAVYRDGNFPALYEGRVFFGDYVEGWIRSAKIDVGGTLSDVRLFMPDAGNVVDIVQAPNGCLGWVQIGSGSIREVCQSNDRDGDGFPEDAGDCDDADPTVFPGATQVCDGKNNDCSDPSWPSVPANEADADLDGAIVCGGDCDDGDPEIHPGASEICNGIDEDCDDVADDGPVCADGNACTADVCDGANGCLATHKNVNLDATGFSAARIDGRDLSVLALAWNSCPTDPPPSRYNPAAKLDPLSTCIGDADFHLFMESFGNTCP